MLVRHILLAVCTLTGLAWSEANAQQPWPPAPRVGSLVIVPVPAVNSPAYRQFLNSESSYKTYSRLTPGRAFSRITPFSAETHYVEPGYLKQINSPFGFESREYVPGFGGYWQTPWYFGGYRAAGSYRLFYGPPLPTPARQ